MQHSKQHITRKFAIVILTFFVGIMTTIVTAVTYDSTVETRANSILNVIKSNASNMTPTDVSSYYALVRMNIKTLMEVLTLVDENLAKELNPGGTTPPISGYIDFQANNCTIPAGKSLCMATLYIGAPTGKIFTVKNPTRAITSANIITPNNYSASAGKYVLTTTFSGDDAANMIKYGENQLELLDGDKIVARAVNMAECVQGTKWNGQICEASNTIVNKPTITLNRTPKVLKQGQSMMMSWNTTNATSFSYYCTGAGVQANKKVPIELNAAPYSNTWENLVKIGWSGVYECDFVAVGAGGTTTLKDSFTIESPTTTVPPSTGTKIDLWSKIDGPKSNYPQSGEDLKFICKEGYRLPTNAEWNDLRQVGAGDLFTKEAQKLGLSSAYYWTQEGDIFYVMNGESGYLNPVKAEDRERIRKIPHYTRCISNGTIPPVETPKLTFTCTKSVYSVGETVSCKISGGVGAPATKYCYQSGTSVAARALCTSYGWTASGNDLVYSKSVSSQMIGDYTLFAEDSSGNKSSIVVVYKAQPISGYIDFQANNCTIPAGKSLCMATLYIGAPTGKIFTVKNPTRAITSANIITPNNYSTAMGKYILTTSISGNDAANMIKYGENKLELLDGDNLIARAVNMAECAQGTKWNGQICESSTSVPPNGGLTFTIENGVLTKNPTTGEYTYQIKDVTPHGLSCYYRPVDILGTLSRLNMISVVTARDSEVIRKLTSFVAAHGGNTTGPDPYGTLAANYPNVGAYCPSYNIPPVYIDFQANNCKITEGKNTCVSTLYIGAPTGKTYTVKNTTRAITSTNIITPNNYSASDKKYVLTNNTLGGDAANHIRYGENTLSLIEGDKEVAKAINSGECATGLKWSGTACIAAIKANPANGVFTISDRNTLNSTITGVTKENTLICNEIIAHPTFPSSVNTGFCNNPSNFTSFTGNDIWIYKDNRWIGVIPYNSSLYGNAGIKTRTFWKDKATNLTATYDIEVVQGVAATPPPVVITPGINLAIPGYPASSQGYLPIKKETIISIDYTVSSMRQCRGWYAKTGESTGYEVNFTGKDSDGVTWTSNHTEYNPSKGTFQLRISYPMTLTFSCIGHDGKTYSESIPFQTKDHNDADTFIETNKSQISQSGEYLMVNWQANYSVLSAEASYCHISKQHTVNGARGNPTVLLETSIDIRTRGAGSIVDTITSPGKYVYIMMCNKNPDASPDIHMGHVMSSNEVTF